MGWARSSEIPQPADGLLVVVVREILRLELMEFPISDAALVEGLACVQNDLVSTQTMGAVQ